MSGRDLQNEKKFLRLLRMPDEEVKPKAIAVTLNPLAREIIEGIREDTGVPNTTAMERLLEWFASLPVKLRLAVLNRDQEAQRELIRAVLSDMAAIEAADPGHAQPVPVSVEQATRIIRVMCGHIERIHLGMTNAEAASAAPSSPRKGRR